jgi:hypothetical protein
MQTSVVKGRAFAPVIEIVKVLPETLTRLLSVADMVCSMAEQVAPVWRVRSPDPRAIGSLKVKVSDPSALTSTELIAGLLEISVGKLSVVTDFETTALSRRSKLTATSTTYAVASVRPVNMPVEFDATVLPAWVKVKTALSGCAPLQP